MLQYISKMLATKHFTEAVFRNFTMHKMLYNFIGLNLNLFKKSVSKYRMILMI